jgi:hypothetical protein
VANPRLKIRVNRRSAERTWRLRADDLEPAYKAAALRLFGEERAQVASLLAQAVDRGGPQALRAAAAAIERSYTDPRGAYHLRWAQTFAELNRRTVDFTADILASKTGLSFGTYNPAAVEAATGRATMLATFIGDTTSSNVTEVVRDSITSGASTAEVREALLEGAFGEDITVVRAERIARTEVIGTLNTGEYARALDADVFTEKEWLHSGNPRDPRTWHLDMDGERIGLEDTFSNGLLHPGEQGAPPEEVIHCGCTLLYWP